MILIRIFTFYVINQIHGIRYYSTHKMTSFPNTFRIKYCLTEVMEQPGRGTPAFNVKAIGTQRHESVSKQKKVID